jgi:hypothetical protein
MNNYKLEDFLNDPNADVGSGLLVSSEFGLCFTLKQKHRWSNNEIGAPVLPFGGIGGKLNNNELPSDSLHREAQEEVGSDIEIIDKGNDVILINKEKVKKITLATNILNEPLPLIIFRSPRAELGRKQFTNVLIYTGKFISEDIKPLDDPALLEIKPKLLKKMVETPMTVSDFYKAGGRITSNIELPENGILKPIGTAMAAVLCFNAGLIIEGDFE